MFEFKMPKLGADMDEGVLQEWKIAPGDHVNKGDVVAVVETSKGAIDIESFVAGEVDSLIVQPNASVPVGAVIAHFRVSEDSAADKSATVVKKGPARTTAVASPPTPPAKLDRPIPVTTGLPVSPRARRLAEQLNVDLATVTGTGPAGSIVAEDVQAVASSNHTPTIATNQPGEQKRTAKTAAAQSNAMRSTIASAMSRSKREIPHYYLSHDIDESSLVSFVEYWNEHHPVAERILPALLYYKAIGVAASEFASMNGFFAEGADGKNAFQPSVPVNLGIAISLRSGGLMAPCLMNVSNRPAVELMRELKDLVFRTRKGGLRASEMSEGTLTVSSLGDRGVDFLAGVIYPPQVALVGIGSMRKKPWAVDDRIEVRPIITLSLAADHRVSDGHTGALFLRRIEELMGQPEKLM